MTNSLTAPRRWSDDPWGAMGTRGLDPSLCPLDHPLDHIPGVSTHAQERAPLRIGRYLTRTEWIGVVLDLTTPGRAILLVRHDDMVEMYLVGVGSITMKVVWSPLQAIIVTIYPHNAHPKTRTIPWQ